MKNLFNNYGVVRMIFTLRVRSAKEFARHVEYNIMGAELAHQISNLGRQHLRLHVLAGTYENGGDNCAAHSRIVFFTIPVSIEFGIIVAEFSYWLLDVVKLGYLEIVRDIGFPIHCKLYYDLV